MATLLTIPVTPSALVTHFDQIVLLDGSRWILSTYTCTEDEQSTDAQGVARKGGWSLDLRELDGTPIVSGIGMGCGMDLLYPYRYLRVPPGPLFVLNVLGSGRDPDPLGFIEGRYRLHYAPVTS